MFRVLTQFTLMKMLFCIIQQLRLILSRESVCARKNFDFEIRLERRNLLFQTLKRRKRLFSAICTLTEILISKNAKNIGCV